MTEYGSAEIYGDNGLGADLQRRLGRRHPAAAVATINAADMRLASVGVPLDVDFEIGSISKGITGLLYSDALGRHEIEPDTTLGELLPLGRCEAAGVTLSSITTHFVGVARTTPIGCPISTHAIAVGAWR